VFVLDISKFGMSAPCAYSPASGIIADFENLFKQFELLKSVRYTHFLSVWKHMQMSFIFAGRQTDRECREVSFFSLLFQQHVADYFYLLTFVIKSSVSLRYINACVYVVLLVVFNRGSICERLAWDLHGLLESVQSTGNIPY
jgi:Small nuclear RNA activating complex (SNAPc), subunit 1